MVVCFDPPKILQYWYSTRYFNLKLYQSASSNYFSLLVEQ